MPNLLPYLEVPEILRESGGEDLDLCFACGTCTGLCPWNLVRDFNVRLLIRSAQLGIEPEDTADVWRCATCGLCVAHCPREVPIIDVTRAMRDMTSSCGSQPATLRAMLASEGQNGNPWAGDPEMRNDWAKELELAETPSAESWMLYTCCTQCYDPETRRAAKALVRLLQKAELPLWLSPLESVCCACSVRETGARELWERMGQSNIELFSRTGAKRILTTSPHCYNAFVHDYPKWKGEFEVLHYTNLLQEMLAEGRLAPKQAVARKVTYHDPCYLGLHNGIYQAPRDCIQAVPEVELIEMPRHHEQSLCCGGGGGQIFMDAPKEERFANLRVQEAIDTGAEVLLTACPYCNSMFRDSIKSLDAEDRIEVMDIAELLWLSIQAS